MVEVCSGKVAGTVQLFSGCDCPPCTRLVYTEATAVAGLLLVNATGLWTGSYLTDYLEHREVPKYWRDALAVYLKPRVLIVMFLGFASGLPLAEAPAGWLGFQVGLLLAQALVAAVLLGLRLFFADPLARLPSARAAAILASGTLAAFWLFERVAPYTEVEIRA